jgi:large subunit ribosomal protein L35
LVAVSTLFILFGLNVTTLRGRPNIPLSAEWPTTQIPDLNAGGTYYIPPHPQKGTKYHRYVLLLLQQPSPAQQISIPVISDKERLGFNVRKFMGDYKLDGSVGGGVHMWREVWDEEVSRIYSEVLSEFLVSWIIEHPVLY